MLTARKMILLATTLVTGIRGHAAELVAKADRSSVGVGESFEVTVTLSSREKCSIEAPNVDGLVVEGQQTSTHMTMDATGVHSEVGTSFQLRATREGSFVVPPWECRVQGKVLKTQPLSIKVEQGKGSAAGTDPAEGVAFIERQLSKASIFKGEQVVLTTSIWITQPLASEPRVSRDFASFVRTPITESVTPTEEERDGRRYFVYRVSDLLVASQEGQLSIPPIDMEAEIKVKTRRTSRSIFDSFFDHPLLGNSLRTIRLRSEPTKIEVIPLPKQGATARFSGLVGVFTLTAKLKRDKINYGEAVDVDVELAGSGVVSGLNRIEWNPGDDWKVYPESPVDEFVADADNGMNGRKMFRFSLVPKKVGTVAIAAPILEVFDVEKKKFHRLTADLPEVNVEGTVPQTKKPQRTPTQEDSKIGPAESVTSVSQNSTSSLIESLEYRIRQKRFWLLGVLVLGCVLFSFLGLWIWRRRVVFLRSNEATFRRKNALKVFLKRLQSVDKVAHLRDVWSDLVCDLKEIPRTKLTLEELKRYSGVTKGELVDFWRLLDEYDFGKRRDEDIDKLKQVSTQLCLQLRDLMKKEADSVKPHL